MNTKLIKAFILAALFTGTMAVTSCDTGTKPGDTNKEDSDHVEEGTQNSGYTSEEPVGSDTTDMAKPYEDAEGAVHAGDGKSDGVDREDIDEKKQ